MTQRSSPLARVLLVCRLAERDMRHRPAVVCPAADRDHRRHDHADPRAGTGRRDRPTHYATTRAATAGPDVVAATVGSVPGGLPADVVRLEQLSRSPGVTGRSGPFPVTFAALRAGGRMANVMAEGRGQGTASVDQPELTQGSWVRPGEVVVERTFAVVLGIHAGDRITLDGRSFRIAGIAVTAAVPPYPNICYFFGCGASLAPLGRGNPGLVWLTQADARSLASRTEPLSYLLNLRLANPASAEAFASAYDARYGKQHSAGAVFIQSIQSQDGQLVMNEQQVLLTGSLLLGLLAVASVAVLVGGRMAEQIRRVGLLKAVGSTPGLVGAVLLAEHLVLAMAAAAIGLAAGWLAAPLATAPGADLLGSATTPPVRPSTIGLVVAVALAVAVGATVIPAIRAARTSTVAALADAARPPRRRPWLIAISARLPVALLLGFPAGGPPAVRRTLLSGVSVAVAVTGIVAVLYARVSLDRFPGGYSGLDTQLDQVLLVVTVALIVLAAVNAILIAWATVLDTRHTSALARTLGATPQQVSTGLSAALVLPALAGVLLAIPALGMGLFVAVACGATLIRPPAWRLLATVLGTVVGVAALTAIPSRLGARRPVAEILGSELA